MQKNKIEWRVGLLVKDFDSTTFSVHPTRKAARQQMKSLKETLSITDLDGKVWIERHETMPTLFGMDNFSIINSKHVR